jgi:hypothetical protein
MTSQLASARFPLGFVGQSLPPGQGDSLGGDFLFIKPNKTIIVTLGITQI